MNEEIEESIKTVRIGTRLSPMAIEQSQLVKDKLAIEYPDVKFEIVSQEASGDRDTVSRLGSHGGKGGAFVNDIRNLLLNDEADIIMHSLKDLPGDEEYYSKDEFCIGAYLERDTPFDCLVVRDGVRVKDVLKNGVIGTSSVRRKAFLRLKYPNVTVIHYRGSVVSSHGKPPSRLDKLDQKVLHKLPYGAKHKVHADALLLAQSGLNRLGLKKRVSKKFKLDEMCPAIGQGVVVVECLTQNKKLRQMLAKINHEKTQRFCNAERTMLRKLNGNCHSPIAGYSWEKKGRLHLRGVVLYPDGTHYSMVEKSSDILAPEELGEIVAKELIDRGARKIIEESKFHIDS